MLTVENSSVPKRETEHDTSCREFLVYNRNMENPIHVINNSILSSLYQDFGQLSSTVTILRVTQGDAYASQAE